MIRIKSIANKERKSGREEMKRDFAEASSGKSFVYKIILHGLGSVFNLLFNDSTVSLCCTNKKIDIENK